MDARYPIGKFHFGAEVTQETRQQFINDIENLPSRLEGVVTGLTEHQMQATYRDGAWTIHQLVHHLADAHMNAFIRFKLAITEDHPTIKPFNENGWIETPDVSKAPVDLSLQLLKGVHSRLSLLLRSFTEEDWKRTFYHPDLELHIPLEKSAGMYAWHGNHHLAHIEMALSRS